MSDADLRALERTDRQRWLVERFRRGLLTNDDYRPGDRVVCVSVWPLDSTMYKESHYLHGVAGTIIPDEMDCRVKGDVWLEVEVERPEGFFLSHYSVSVVKPEGA